MFLPGILLEALYYDEVEMPSVSFFFCCSCTLQYKAIGEELQLAHYALGGSRVSVLVRRERE